jgi:hypothetical protein
VGDEDGNRNRVSKGEGPLHPSIEGISMGIGVRGILEEGALEECGYPGIEATVARNNIPADPSLQLLPDIGA